MNFNEALGEFNRVLKYIEYPLRGFLDFIYSELTEKEQERLYYSILERIEFRDLFISMVLQEDPKKVAVNIFHNYEHDIKRFVEIITKK